LPYVVAKSAVLGVTRAAARELGGYGITVNAVSPGTVETSMLAAAVNADEIRASRSVLTLAGRLGHPYEIAAAVAYLVSEEAAFVTGQALVVDGGRIDKF
jgi:NAD(P)-dependent dehydrogenase (short-subunit alcohol dehydrogenase family)